MQYKRQTVMRHRNCMPLPGQANKKMQTRPGTYLSERSDILKFLNLFQNLCRFGDNLTIYTIAYESTDDDTDR